MAAFSTFLRFLKWKMDGKWKMENALARQYVAVRQTPTRTASWHSLPVSEVMFRYPRTKPIRWLILLCLDMQSDGSPHFLRMPQEIPMYHSTSSPRTSRLPSEELSGPRSGPSEVGSPTSTRNPMTDWQMRTSGRSEDRCARKRGRHSKTTSRPPGCS